MIVAESRREVGPRHERAARLRDPQLRGRYDGPRSSSLSRHTTPRSVQRPPAEGLWSLLDGRQIGSTPGVRAQQRTSRHASMKAVTDALVPIGR